MQDTKQNSQPAFPVIAQSQVYSTGMTLRDYFAGQIIPSITSFSLEQPIERGDTKQIAAARYARIAYEIADAMLAEREKEVGHE